MSFIRGILGTSIQWKAKLSNVRNGSVSVSSNGSALGKRKRYRNAGYHYIGYYLFRIGMVTLAWKQNVVTTGKTRRRSWHRFLKKLHHRTFEMRSRNNVLHGYRRVSSATETCDWILSALNGKHFGHVDRRNYSATFVRVKQVCTFVCLSVRTLVCAFLNVFAYLSVVLVNNVTLYISLFD